jgi:gamma-glutamyltranspeptidase / glutathione hydrolase
MTRTQIAGLAFVGLLGVGLLACLMNRSAPSVPTSSMVTTIQSHGAKLNPPGVYDSDHLECQNGVVVTISSPASNAGLSILKRGGNAVDAAVATAFALAVTYPASGNLAGGGFMLVHPAPDHGDPVVFDYRETAPAAARRTMFGKQESQYECKSVAVPGTIRGLAMAHKRFGTLPWSELIQPAITLAQEGFRVDPYLADLLNDVLASAPNSAELQRVFAHPGGGAWKAGDHLVEPDLAKTLQVLADQGPDAFYIGPIAKEIVAEMNRGNGVIVAADLAGYEAIERQPLVAHYRGQFDVYVPPPPSSGGTTLIEELNMLETFDCKRWGRWSPELLHVMAECMRRAAYDRARYLGDPAFVEIPAKLVTPEYGQELAKTIDLHKATRSLDISTEIPIASESENTTHFSIIDKNGMAVANTYTLERIWGSRIVVKDMGFILNNDMRAFNIFPGVTDSKGQIGTAPNTIAAGKRPLSSQMPTIVAKDGRVVLITGSPGSQSIPNTLLCLLVSALDYEIPLPIAVESPRLSHQWFPDQLFFEAPEQHPKTVAALQALGHTVVRVGPIPQGDAHSIWVTAPNRYLGVADHRRNDRASVSGY